MHARYIPNIVLERFGTAEARPLLAAEHTRFDAAVAFVDISGFTKLSEKLMQDHGTGGAELLNKFVSAYFEKLIEVIVQWGGEYVAECWFFPSHSVHFEQTDFNLLLICFFKTVLLNLLAMPCWLSGEMDSSEAMMPPRQLAFSATGTSRWPHWSFERYLYHTS